MTVSQKAKVNVLAYFIIQTTFGILYFTFDVCTKVDQQQGGGGGGQQHQDLNLADGHRHFSDKNNKNNSDKFSEYVKKLYLPSTKHTETCANLQNATNSFSVFFSKLEDVVWVRTCMISVMGVMAFLVSLCARFKQQCCLKFIGFSPRHSSIIVYKILLFIGCAFVLCGTFVSAITVKESLPLFILT